MPFTDTAIAGFEGGAAAKAFASLPERWQLVLWHLEVENQKPAEIAPLLGMSANSVSALAYRAREGLRQAFLNMHSGDLADVECRQTHDLLGGYVRRGLARRDTTRVEDHLQGCRRCTATYLELEEVNSSLSALLGPAVLGGVSAAYLGGAGFTALGGSGTWAGLIQLLDRSKDVVLASPAASMATASVVSVTTATAVVAGVQATPLALPSLQQQPSVAAAAGACLGGGDDDEEGFAALDRLREEIDPGWRLRCRCRCPPCRWRKPPTRSPRRGAAAGGTRRGGRARAARWRRSQILVRPRILSPRPTRRQTHPLTRPWTRRSTRPPTRRQTRPWTRRQTHRRDPPAENPPADDPPADTRPTGRRPARSRRPAAGRPATPPADDPPADDPPPPPPPVDDPPPPAEPTRAPDPPTRPPRPPPPADHPPAETHPPRHPRVATTR